MVRCVLRASLFLTSDVGYRQGMVWQLRARQEYGPAQVTLVILHMYLTYLLTYLHTPWCRVLLKKLHGSQVVKKFPVFYGTRRFIIAFTIMCHLSLS